MHSRSFIFGFLTGLFTVVVMLAVLIGAAFASDLRVIDGDTFEYQGEMIRIENIDTPELRGKCDTEVMLAYGAKARLEQLLDGEIDLERSGKGKYGRTIARVYVGGKDVGEVLISEGFARPWRGKREPWCK